MATPIQEGGFLLRTDGEDADGIHPVLTGVSARGRVDGAMFTLTLRQTYCNTSARTLEVVYTFPLPQRAVLLDMAAEFGARRMACQVLPRRQAEEVYEQALHDGDAPVLLEHLGDGLHTANIGNLKRDEMVTLEIRFAQPLTFDQGLLRLAVPMTIAPRYGWPKSAGLQPQQEPKASLRADYPLELTVDVVGNLAAWRLECPSHAVHYARTADGVSVSLGPSARMDRDVVLSLAPAGHAEHNPCGTQPTAVLSVAADPVLGGTTALAVFSVPRTSARRPVALKLLVDGSGSMMGDSIHSARQALDAIAQALDERDEISFSRFGSDTEVALYPKACTEEAALQLRRQIRETQATLGGTEMAQALLQTLALRRGPLARLGVGASTDGSDVLLITDGEVWDVDETIDAARDSGQRVFVIGVGTSPAEGVLRRMAHASGGACEFAAPGEALRATALRMLRRMRQAPTPALRVDWGLPDGAEPAWTLPPPQGVFSGDTVLVMAGFAPGVQPGRVRLLAAQADSARPRAEVSVAECRAHQSACAGDRGAADDAADDDLPRIAAAQRMALWLEGTDLEALVGEQTPASALCPDPDALDEASIRRRIANLPRDMPEVAELDDLTCRAVAMDLALAYRLVSPVTHAVLVHRRDDADKPEDEATPHRVASMLAAGWGGMGTVLGKDFRFRPVSSARRVASPPLLNVCAAAPVLYRTTRSKATADAPVDALAMSTAMSMSTSTAATSGHACAGQSMLSVATAAPVARPSLRSAKFGVERTPSAAAQVPITEAVVSRSGIDIALRQPSRPHTLAEITHAIADHLAAGQSVESLNDLAQTFRYTTKFADAMLELIDLESEPGMAWLWLAHWVIERHGDGGALPDRQPLRDRIEDLGVSPALLAQVKTVLERRLGRVDPTSWRTPRSQRLARYLETL